MLIDRSDCCGGILTDLGGSMRDATTMTSTARPVPPPPPAGAFVGRRSELATLDALHRTAGRDPVRLAAIWGPARWAWNTLDVQDPNP
jgi:hypothetical protein